MEDDGSVDKKTVQTAGTEDFESDFQTNASAFEALERDFQEVSSTKRKSRDFLLDTTLRSLLVCMSGNISLCQPLLFC